MYPVMNRQLGQQVPGLPPDVQRKIDIEVDKLQSEIEADMRAKMKSAITEAALLGGGVGLVLGVFLTPIVQDLLGIKR